MVFSNGIDSEEAVPDRDLFQNLKKPFESGF